MKLAKLKEIMDYNFGPPFLPEGMVTTNWVGSGDERSLSITIDRRDVSIDKDGNVIAAGTFLV